MVMICLLHLNWAARGAQAATGLIDARSVDHLAVELHRRPAESCTASITRWGAIASRDGVNTAFTSCLPRVDALLAAEAEGTGAAGVVADRIGVSQR
jgi:hypothetical protein